ncbi:Tyrosine--tRNA ligase [Seminavis robusta]|uniref:Tyrosine--tRNA ligase n=1 Tax=Seminavis robusta TaxID=568900 RepID=A0A9N8HYY9_9STRA|nr:Tyrosine--tRNA ligase [Seminavis robusta]|eukprot:Sro3091_g343560.1 Tyrosine--tRNA ligase (504) ;mRNA; f:3219-4730
MKFIMTTATVAALLVATTRTVSSFTAKSVHVVSKHSTKRNWSVPSATQKVFLSATTAVETEQPNSSAASSLYAQENAEALASLQSPFLQVMRDRGFFHQCTNLIELDQKMTDGSIAAYLGFDATADSLHVGSLLQIMILRHLQQAGHRPIVLVGGGTSKVGDPTGKDESRVMLGEEDIQRNIQGISKVFQKFLTFQKEDSDDFSDAIMVNNDDWLSSLKYLEFLREYGTQFTINRMLSFESVKQRLEREAPFSFLEFNYMILQAYDFVELYRRHGAILQLGGSDQWGNMVSGAELGRRCESAQLFALTAPLITTSDGKKMGKTAGGAVWLNQDKLSPFDYWQFWRNTDDADVIRFMKLFTELPLEQIAELEQLTGADINKAKIVLADEATTLLHGKDSLKSIHETTANMFKGSGASTEGLPRVFVSESDLSDSGKKILDLFVELKLASSKKEARRLIAGGGARLGETKIEDEMATLTLDDFDEGSKEVTLRAGKKRAGVVEVQ